jgi:hypothetical protein
MISITRAQTAKVIAALCIVILAFALRFHLLGAQSLWNDEGNSYVQATRTFIEIADHAARDIHPPGYYWLLSVWRSLTGEGEFALRALSAFASVLTVGFTYALGKRLFSPLAGLSAALFVALNTFSLYYAQEARMYALLALWSAGAMWAFAGFLRSVSAGENGWKWAVALALFNAAGLWTQYAYPFVMLAQGVTFVVWVGVVRLPLRVLIAYILTNLLTIALYAPWLPFALPQITSWPNTGQPTPLNIALQLLAGWFTFGITVAANDASWVAVALLLVAFGLRRKHTWPHLLVPVAWVVVPVGLFLLIGLFREANLKFLLPSQIAVALLMGRGVWVLWTLRISSRRRLIQLAPNLAAVVAVIGMTVTLWNGLQPLYHHADYQRDDYRAIAHTITTSPHDAIILNAPNQEEVFRYYYHGESPIFPLPSGLGGDDAATQSTLRAIIDQFENIAVVFWGEAERDPNRVVEGTLDTQTFEVRSDWYGDVRLARYVTPAERLITQESGARFGEHITLERYALSADTIQPGDVLQVQLQWRTTALLDTRYKVFVQLLDADGQLVTQRDSEPGGGLALTTTWQPGINVVDNHALMIPNDLSLAHYSLIIGLYNETDPEQRLPVGDTDYLQLADFN